MTQQTRELAIGQPDAKARTVPVVLSTEAPVDRGDFIEVLDHSNPASIDLSRAPLPLIESHDQRQLPIGTVDGLRLEGRKLRGIARFGTSRRAQEVFQDVLDGTVRSVSIAYEYAGNPIRQGDGALRFPFRPLEVSAVSVPADPAAGFFRSYYPMNTNTPDQTVDPITTLSRAQRRAAAADLEDQRSAVELERARVAEITAMCRAHSVPDSLQDEMIRDGLSIPEARNVVLERIIAKGRNTRSLSGGETWGGDEREMRNYSLSRAILAAASNDWSKAGLEREASREIARRTQRESQGFFVPIQALARDYGTATAAAGGSLVETSLQAGSFIELLRNKSRVLQLGATVLSGLVGNVDIPRRTAAGTAQWIDGDTGALTASTGAFDKVSLRPKTVGNLSVITRNLLLQGTPDAEMLVRADLIAKLAEAIDLAAIAGTGASSQPLGLLNIADVLSVEGGTNGAAINFDHMIDLSIAVAEANADSGALGYLSTPAVLGALSRLKSSTGEYLWAGRGGVNNETSAPASAVPGSTAGSDRGYSVLGHTALFSNNVPKNLTKGAATGCSAVIFGNWSDLVIGEWGVLEILPNAYAPGIYERGAIQLRALQTVDVAVRHGESFAAMKDAITS